MPRRTAALTPPSRRHSDRGESLVDWREPEANAHVLDWRQRAHEFGLVPLEENGAVDGPLIEPAERLLAEEEPEAFAAQPLEMSQREDLQAPAIEERRHSKVPQEELDLVRVYLKQIGRRKLLKIHEEQEIGRRIEMARGQLLSELATIPAARLTLLSLADSVARNETSAAELILLPDGGELRPEKIDPILRAFGRVRRLEKSQIDRFGPRGTDVIGRILRGLPIRPAVVDDIVTELTGLAGTKAQDLIMKARAHWFEPAEDAPVAGASA